MTPRYTGPSRTEYDERRAAVARAYDALSADDKRAVDAVCKRLH